MNTPAHAVIALLLVPNRRDDLWMFAAVVAGAVLPDAPMILFYGIQKLVLHTPETVMWSSAYHDPSWQTFFDLFNSIPLILMALLGAYAARMPRLMALTVSMLIHCLCDLPVHHDDGHRHFFPLSDFRFQSPVSYWDPAHYGNWFLIFEFTLVALGTLWLLFKATKTSIRIGYGVLGFSYLAFGVFVMINWSGMSA